MTSGSLTKPVLVTLVILISGQTGQASVVTVRDTVTLSPDGISLFLAHPPVIDSTLSLTLDGAELEHFTLSPIHGSVTLDQPGKPGSTLIATYLSWEGNLPSSVGRSYNSLPHLDSLTNDSPEKAGIPQLNEPVSHAETSGSVLRSSGTLFRRFEMAPMGGSNLSGGLRMQLQGELMQGFHFNGVLSDQNMPLQPEGNTRNLEELDQIYLQLSHTDLEITAGDISVLYNSGKYLNIERKLIGIKNSFKIGDWTGKALYGGSKGRFRSTEFKGQDGNQGPYYLTTDTGDRNLVVQAGSERIWVDGQRVTRGERGDYIIDYSTGEVWFNPKRIIHADTDIYVEYQYSDLRFTRSMTGASLQRTFNQDHVLSISWLKEYDRLSSLDEDPVVEQMKLSGDNETFLSGAVQAENGDYYLSNGIWTYGAVDDNTAGGRYNVSFQRDIDQGEYARSISPEGRVYYRYIQESERDQFGDLYSPHQKIANPVAQDIIQVAGLLKVTDKTQLDVEAALSRLDRNTLSHLNDNDNRGGAYKIRIQSRDLRLTRDWSFSYHIQDWLQQSRFETLERDRGVYFQREWNLDELPAGEEQMTSSGAQLKHPDHGKADVEWSRYRTGNMTRNRWLGTLDAGAKYVPEVKGSFSQVWTQKTRFQRSSAMIVFLPAAFHPYLAYQGESDEFSHRFGHGTVGLRWDRNGQSYALGMGKRVDERETDSLSTGLEPASEGYFGELDIAGRSPRGWSRNIVLRKRIKVDRLSKENFDYELAMIDLFYRDRTSPFRWDTKIKLEETYAELRAVVYDSIGLGQGMYRFDSDYNDYVTDLNGDYRSFTVFTGQRQPTSRFSGIQRLAVDFGRLPITPLKDVSVSADIRLNFEGQTNNYNHLLSPSLDNEQITRSQWFYRLETDYHPQNTTRRIRVILTNSQDLNGYDPRGNDLRTRFESRLDWDEPLNRNLMAQLLTQIHRNSVRSSFSALRNRSAEGTWIEAGVTRNRPRKWQITLQGTGGWDQGEHYETDYSAWSTGVEMEGSWFVGKSGRIQGRVNWNRSHSLGELKTIPPEALNGLALGQSYRGDMQFHMIVGNNLSANLSLRYLSDSRIHNLIFLTGELRAFF